MICHGICYEEIKYEILMEKVKLEMGRWLSWSSIFQISMVLRVWISRAQTKARHDSQYQKMLCGRKVINGLTQQ